MVKRPHCYHKDVGSNPITTRNKNQTLGTPPQKVAQWSGQDLSGRPVMKAELDLEKKQNKKTKKMSCRSKKYKLCAKISIL